ncbi:hypothetical protein LNQ82_06530 [Conchiformibius steedae DSM 2580]|uniref:TnsE C-terminal domain-containing protein n=2 Tax=Conchiformibius steedae TaxID=153493 RepID=A0AAE9HUG6_9NEIS|nr:hypothetical protein [Conchiformibius steedae]URD66873.1 hypothetical protein LNQ82_06530 [Conchiformibius steedae DSM 2580]
MQLGVKMTQQPIIEIAEFPHDNRLWRIDYLSEITSKLQRNNNIMIEVILRPVSDATKADFSQFTQNGTENFEWQQRCQCNVNIGALPILTIGSLWKNGCKQLENAISEITTFEKLMIDVNQFQIIDSNERIEYAENKFCKLILQKYFPSTNQATSYLVIPHNTYKRGIIFPVMEIIRFYYACSTNLAHLAFSNPDKLSTISYDTDNENNKVIIHLPQKYTDNEAFILARILSNEIAFQGFTSIKSAIEIASINLTNTLPLFKTPFPFSEPSNLTVRGIPIYDRFLVTEICSCSAPFPNVIVIRHNDGRKANPETDIAENDKKPYQRQQPTATTDDNLAIQNQDESAYSHQPLQVKLNINCFDDLNSKKVEKLDKPFNQYQAQHRIITTNTQATGLGVDMGISGQTTILQANIDATQSEKSIQKHRESLAATFEHTIEMIEYLEENYADVSVNFYSDENTSLFIPLLKPVNKKQWSYLDSEKRIKRKVLIGKIEYQQKIFWLIEFEARKSEHFNTALIYLKSNDDEILLKKLLHELAYNKGIWDKISSNHSYHISTFKHTHKDIKSFAEKVYGKIKE